MKKLLSLAGLCVTLIIACTSCSKIDMADLVGTWKVVKIEFVVTANGQVVDSEGDDELTGAQITFNANGTFKTYASDDEAMEGTYAVKGSTISLTLEGETNPVSVSKMTSTEMIWVISESYQEEGVKVTETATAHFQKI